MFVVNNLAEIQARGGRVYGDDDFEIVCVDCGCQYLYNSEVLELYDDQRDLSVRYLNAEGGEHSALPAMRRRGLGLRGVEC